MHEPNVPDNFLDGLFRVDGLVAVVTGGASGLGEAMAHGLAQAGATVAIADWNEAAAKDVAASVVQRPYALHPYGVDITKKADVEELVAAVARDHGSVDILVNSMRGPGTC